MNSIPISTHTVSVSRMLRLISMKNGSVNMPIQGGVSLSHLRASNSISRNKDIPELNLSKALALNNIIDNLTRIQKNQLDSMYADAKAGRIKQSELVNAIRDITRQNNNNDFTQSISRPIGLLLNTTV